jgi:hypothetical protein
MHRIGGADIGKGRLPGPRLAQGSRRPLRPGGSRRLHAPGDPPAFPGQGKTTGRRSRGNFIRYGDSRKRRPPPRSKGTPASSTSPACRAARSSTRGCSRDAAPPVLPRPGKRAFHEPVCRCASAVQHEHPSDLAPGAPFRICAHNGEINTLRGNINRMRAREATLSSPLLARISAGSCP